MLRSSVLTFVLGTVSAIGACYSSNADPDDESSGGSSAGNSGKGGTASGGRGGSTSRGGATGDPPLGGSTAGGADSEGGETSSSGSSSGGTGGTGGTTSCVTETRLLEDLIEAGAGGQIDFTICDFYVPADVDDSNINVYIGGSKLCWLGSSQGCDLTPMGWWLNGGQILLCDAACSAYFDPEPDIPVSIEIGCPNDTCL